MNEEPPIPFDTVGDAPVEARIVAWVLGEASAFEAAELERLCEERPELLVFRRRMRALHGLLTEAEAAEPDESWKLPAEKRRVLDEMLGEDKIVSIESDQESKIRRSGRRALLAIAACLMLTVFLGAILASGSASVQKSKKNKQAVHASSAAEIAASPPSAREMIVDPSPDSGAGMSLQLDAPSKPQLQRRAMNSVAAAEAPAPLPELAESSAMKPMPFGIDDFADTAPTGGAGEMASRGPRQRVMGPVPSMAKESEGLAKNDDAPADRFAPEEPDAPMGRAVVGLRSGDQAINRNYIDAILDNPNRSPLSETGGIQEPELQRPGKDSSAAAADLHLQAGKKIESSSRAGIDLSDQTRWASQDEGMKTRLNDGERATAARRSLDIAKEKLSEAKKVDDHASDNPPRAELPSRADSPQELAVPAKKFSEIASDQEVLEKFAEGRLAGSLESSVPQTEMAQYAGFLLPAGSEKSDEAYLLMGAEFRSKSELENEVDLYGELQPRDSTELALPGADSSSAFKPKVEITREFNYPTEYEPAIIPKQDLTKVMEELAATEEPYSTFSLNISDASFQIAKAALDKGERPDPSAIKVEQFYNAVDYGDPAPGSNEPVAATIEQSVHPVIPGRNLVRVALKTAAAGRGATQPLRLTLLVDQSGSMVREDRRVAMANALKQLSGLLTKNDHITVVGFSRESHLLADNLTGDQAGKLGDLINQAASEGGTNLEQAFNLGEQMATRQQIAGEQNRIVLFTDGAANLGNANPERLAERVKSLRQKGIAFDIAGIGADGVNDRLLSELARNGNGRYYVVGDEKNDSFARQLAGAFRPAAENVKVQVHFNPERVGRYKLIGFEKDRLKTEDFRNDTVDAAELAAEEAGVAIYQVETLPQGTGEIGEVSVRFRDTAKGEIVERKWTMPFESATQPFDRAAPSMQLAGLSLLAAEKLKGGPLADAIDFKQLTGPRSLVKQFYGSSRRVGDMLHVIEVIK